MEIYETRSYVLICPCISLFSRSWSRLRWPGTLMPCQSYIGMGQNLYSYIFGGITFHNKQPFWGTIRVTQIGVSTSHAERPRPWHGVVWSSAPWPSRWRTSNAVHNLDMTPGDAMENLWFPRGFFWLNKHVSLVMSPCFTSPNHWVLMVYKCL